MEEEKKENPNEILEVSSNEDITATLYDIRIPEEEKKKHKPKKVKMHNYNTKKIIIILSIVIGVIIIGLIVLFLLKNKDDDKPKKSNKEEVVIENSNYSYKDGNLIFKDDSKTELGSYKCTNANENLCYVAYFNSEDNFDEIKQVYENGSKVNLRSVIYDDNFVFIFDNESVSSDKVLLYDITEKEVKGTYHLVKEATPNIAIVKNEDETYNALLFNNKKIEPLFDEGIKYIGHVKNTDYLVISDKDDNYRLVDLEGKDVSKNIKANIKSFNTKYISAEVDKKYSLYNYEGKTVNDNTYDYIRFIDNYIFVVNSKKLSVYDIDFNPILLDGITLKDDKYNTEYIYNSDLVQKGKKVSFDALISDEEFKIEYNNDNVKTINVSESKINNGLNYINYFDGKLYFYSDKDKTKLIGTYKCKNQNVVDKDTKELRNCFIAKENNILTNSKSDNYIPIYNDRYVFIYDNSSDSTTTNINLYNLKTETILKTYLEVDADYHKSDEDIAFIDTTGTLIAAKNTKGSYGVINLGSTNVTGVIAFSNDDVTNDYITYLKDYYLIKRSDGTYHLYDKKNNEITSNIVTKSKIVDYNSKYIIVENNGLYKIYSLDGKIISKEYKYINLYDNYYITVDANKKLGVYKYDSSDSFVNGDIIVDNYDIQTSLNNNIVRVTYKYNNETLSTDVLLEKANSSSDNGGNSNEG